MNSKRQILAALAFLCLASSAARAADNETAPARDPKQPVDDAYTEKIHKYTTQPYFASPLVDYLPASKTVPTPQAVLGDISGAPGILPYAEDVYKYMRLLEKATPRVKVYAIGKTEAGREMIAVAVSSEENIKNLEENRVRLSKLADPRTIKLDDAEADKLVAQAVPIYYITGTIHSPETGAPTALMELAYRLAVDESLYIKEIRDGTITLITPVVEVDGRDRMVDIYKWHLAHPKEFFPWLVYWGKYVAHDNNRDAMGVTLKLTENVLNTYVGWKAQVLHDLHESVPYLYDNTIGDEPYNAWIDPILADEWQVIGWNNVSAMTKFGMPGVFAHGDFDTWSPGYLMFIAALHNGISTQNANKMKIVGSVVGTRLVDDASPIAYGYDEKGAGYCDNGPIFSLSSIAGQRGRRRLGPEMHARPTGRGSSDDPDFTVGRVGVEAPEEPKTEIWEAPRVLDEQRRNGFRVIPAALRPRVIFRYADSKDLLISGLVEGGDEIAQHPAVVEAPSGKGHVVLFSINPVYRGETWGTYSMVLNTILNFDSLNAGRKDSAEAK